MRIEATDTQKLNPALKSRQTNGGISTICGFHVSLDTSLIVINSFRFFPSLNFDVYSVYLYVTPRFFCYTHFSFFPGYTISYAIFFCLFPSCYRAVRCAIVSMFLSWPTLFAGQQEYKFFKDQYKCPLYRLYRGQRLYKFLPFYTNFSLCKIYDGKRRLSS